MKLGKALLSMVTGFAAGTLLGALFATKKGRKTLKKKEKTNKSE